MTQHNHPEMVPGCFRCDLSADGRMPYFEAPGQSGYGLVSLDENPFKPGDLKVSAEVDGFTVRVGLSEESALRLADAIHRWYGSPVTATDEMVATDLTEGTDHGA